jgi:HAD superfamily hydrolase (TIGR01459 family)
MSSPTSSAPELCTVDTLIERYDGLLFDAFGVLLAHDGALPGATDTVAHLQREGVPFLVVSNDSSRTLERAASFYESLGFAIGEDRIITSGSLVPAHFAAHGLEGARCLVLGPADSRIWVERAGGRLVEVGEVFDVLVVSDESGYPFLETLDEVISALFAAYGEGREVELLLTNPDHLYPKGPESFGVAAGSVALVIETALARRFPGRVLRFTTLGKPARPIFDAARARLGDGDYIMLGDQLATDVSGALDAGLDAALVETGLDRWTADSPVTPTLRLSSLVR